MTSIFQKQELQNKIKEGEKNWKQNKKNSITEGVAISFLIGLLIYIKTLEPGALKQHLKCPF